MAKLTPQARALQFIASRKTVFLATKNSSGELWASSAPFVLYQKRFYVGGNYIAERTRDLIETGEACLMFRASESDAPNLFALERFTLRARAIVVEEEDEWNAVISLFYKKFGKAFDFMKGLPDFYLFRIEPLERKGGDRRKEHGLYVRGFAQAYDILPYFMGSAHVQGSHREREGVPAVVRTPQKRSRRSPR